jgi:aminoglycoside phosphotransferase family enzyme/predicted kinase
MGCHAGTRPRVDLVLIEDLITALRDPRAYAHPVREVGFLQTHISVLFFAGDRVYKLKKPVDLGFVDFSTLERRRHFCQEEVRLNRRMAPDVYRGVVSIHRQADGRLKIGGDGVLLEYAVEMERLPAEQMLDVLLEQGRIDSALIRNLVELLADFHRRADTGADVDGYGTPQAVRALVLGNLREMDPGDSGCMSPVLRAFLIERCGQFVREHVALMERRVVEGRVRDGHGDLHAGNICVTDAGLVAYDCLEFSAALRCSDVACDLAFLAMDLDRRGYRGFGRDLVRRYADLAGDPELRSLMDFYKTHRALVRAKVAALEVADLGRSEDERTGSRLRAMGYAHLAASYQLPPVVLLTCGLPASGKSWLARELARPFEAVILRSDVLRKRDAGLAPTDRVTGAAAHVLYAAGRTRHVYAELRRETLSQLQRGRSVVVDATFSSAAQRAAFLDGLDGPTALVHISCEEAEVKRRMELRAHDRAEVSDADWAVYLAARDRFEAPGLAEAYPLVQYRSGEEALDCVSRVIDSLVTFQEGGHEGDGQGTDRTHTVGSRCSKE